MMSVRFTIKVNVMVRWRSAAPHDCRTDCSFEMLFVNAGTANHDRDETIANVSIDEFFRVMVTNALSPMASSKD